MVPPMARGFTAFARGDCKTAAAEIEPLLATHERLGGSRAQRDLLEYVVPPPSCAPASATRRRHSSRRRRPHNAKVGGFPLAGL